MYPIFATSIRDLKFRSYFWQFIPAENSLIIHVTMPIAIATDQ